MPSEARAVEGHDARNAAPAATPVRLAERIRFREPGTVLEPTGAADALVAEPDGDLVLLGHSVFDEVGATFATNTYTHDAAGRCDIITTVGEAEHVERRDYDRAGRLWHQYIEGEVGAPDDPRAERGNSVVTFQYDELGRLRSTAVAGPDDLRITVFGVNYRSDASFVVEQNWLSDTNDTFSRTVWSPGCNELRGLLTPERNGPCSANYVLVGDIAF